MFQALEPVIPEALAAFSARAGGDVEFGPEAAHLDQPEGAARPSSPPAEVRYLGETVGKLTVVVFKYYDGTGNESGVRISSSEGFFLETAKAKPRPDRASQRIHGDVHLPLASFRGEVTEPGLNTKLLAGSLSLFASFRGEVIEVGYLGQDASDFDQTMSGTETPPPIATATVKSQRLDPLFSGGFSSRWTNDLRTVYNRRPAISQVAAFLTLDRDDHGAVSRTQANMLRELGTVEPVLPGQAPRLLRPLQGR